MNWLHSIRGKLSARYIGPYPITKVISPSSYQVDLPTSLKRVHPVFNVSHLKPYQDGTDQFPDLHPTPPPPVPGPFGKPEWTVEQILDRRPIGCGHQYLVKWLGYPACENSWEPATKLKQDVPHLIRVYDKKHPF